MTVDYQVSNLCPKGHDRDKVGVTRWRRCRQCERDRLRLKAQRDRERKKEARRYDDPRTRVKPVTDGLEALYGPVPDLVPDSEWFDHVIVDRALSKRPCGRGPYPLEWAEIIRRMPRAEVTDVDVAWSTGVDTKQVSRIRGVLDERRSIVLTTE